MLKHTELLNKMSAKQKISLIADIDRLADDEYTELGIPRVKFATLDDIFARHGNGLTPYALARSWDTGLIVSVTEEILKQDSEGANVIVIPSPKINLGAEGSLALSEDPYLSTQLSLSFLSAVTSAGKVGVLPDFYLSKREVASLDATPDKKALHDFLYSPFATVVKKGGAKAVIGSISKNAGEYEEFNRSLIRRNEKYFPTDTDVLCLCKTYDETLAALDENCIIYKGVEIAIENAYDQYLGILSSIEMGRASMLSLEEAFAHKSAISDQMLDAAADKVIDFAFRVNGIFVPSVTEEAREAQLPQATAPITTNKDEKPSPVVDPMTKADDAENAEQGADTEEVKEPPKEELEKLLTTAIRKTTTLIKNENGTLPLLKDKSFAIIGDAAFGTRAGETSPFYEHFISCSNGRCVGVERGYDILEDRSDSLVAPALELANKASTVFVFLKPRTTQNASNPCTSLPANQAALINALSGRRYKVVAVISTDANLDISFAKSIDAVLLAPISGRLSAIALADALFGRASVGGKLTTTFYTSPSKFHKKQRFYKDTGRNKTGIFVGYRFYDTQDIPISYPFGFGLRYSEIEITNARSFSDSLSFTVTNKGSSDIDETIGIYISMPDSKVLRPQKELKAFFTLSVEAGQSRRVTVKNPDFKIYDAASDSYLIESGRYDVYLGTSVTHVKAVASSNVCGQTLTSSSPVLSDYLQSETNIISNDFTLEAKHERMANYKSLRNAGLIALLVSVLVGLMSLSTESPLIPLIIGSVILLASIALFVASHNIRAKVRIEEKLLIEKNKEMFEGADSAETEKLDDLFLKEFKFDVSDYSAVAEVTEEIYDNSGLTMLNDTMSFALAAADLRKSASESGISFDTTFAANLISSFASSRLIIAKGADTESSNGFVNAIAGYFGASLFTETVTEAHSPDGRLLYVTVEEGSTTSTAVLSALISAEEKPQTMHVIHLKNIPAAKLGEYLVPYIKYLGNPTSGAEVCAKGSDDLYSIPSNVWFITDLEKGALVENIPSYVLEYASVLTVKFAACEIAETKSEIVPITLTDFDHLTERCKSRYILNESVFKKIDAIEAFVSKHSSYKIGNKLWIRIETYASALLSTEIELPVAIDSTLASVVLPTLASALSGKLDSTDKTLVDELERVFGEDNVPMSHDVLISKS